MPSSLRNVDERGAHEREIERLNRLYAALSHVNQAILRQDSREELLASVCRILVEHGGFRMAWIGWHDPASMRLTPVTSYGDDDNYLARIAIYADDRTEGRGPTGTAFREERPYVCNDIGADPAMLPWRDEAERRGFRSSAVFVIREQGQPSGTLTVYAGEKGVFRDEEMALLAEVAADVSFGIENLAREVVRKDVERALASTADLLERTAEMARVGGWEYDLNTNTLVWSRETYRLHDLTPGAPIESTAAINFYPPEVRPRIEQMIGVAIRDGTPWDAELPLITANGRRIWVRGQGVVVMEDRRAVKLIGTLQDITDRMEAEATTARGLERLTEAQRIGQIGDWELDLATQAISWSPQVYEILGRDPSLGPPRDFAENAALWEEASATLLSAKVAAAIATGEVQKYELLVRRPDGGRAIVDATAVPRKDQHGTVVALFGTVQDITARRRAEEAAVRLAAIVESSEDAIVGKNLAGIVTSWNPGAERLFGYSAREMIGQSIAKIVPIDRQNEEVRILDRIGHGESVSHFETVRLRKDGTSVDVSVTISAIKDAAGQVIGASKLAHDITAEKRDALAVAASELRYRRLFETAKDGILILDADTGMVVDVNPFLMQLLGFSHDQFLGKSVWDLGFFKDIVANEARFAELRAKEYLRYENLPLETSGGERIEVEFISNVYEVNGRKVVQCSVRDVSDRRRAEAAGKESEVRYRTLFENSPDGIAVARDGSVFVEVNANLCRMLGYTRAELIGRPTAMILPERDLPRQGEWKGALMESPTYRRERWLQRKDGSQFPVEVIASFLPDGNLQSNIRDITDRKAAETALRDAASRIAGIVNAAMDAIITINAEQHIILFNPAAERMFGYDSATMLGTSLAQLIPAITREAHAGHIRRFEQTGTTSRRMGAMDEISGLRANGEEFPIEASISQTEVAGEKLFTVILRDVTARKKLEQQFLRTQRMESIGTLAGGIAHDLNNALAPIIMSLELLKMTFIDDNSQELIATLGKSAQHGADMVRQLLSFARGVEGQRVEVQVRHLVQEIEKMVRDTFLKTVQVRTNVTRDLWTVLGDATQIHQVLMNLCVNARDAMPEGGRLVITAENVALDAQYAGANIDVVPGPYVVIQVEDSGTGMPPGVIEKIFDPFFTTKEVGKGTGLGLSTSLAIIRSHGGFIRVYSEPGTGTKFTVFLPAQGASSGGTPAVEASLPRGQGELILVVDDEFSVCQVTQQTLEAFGYRVLIAHDGAEAVALYAARGKEIAAVLTDMMMPMMDGIATIRVLRKLNPAVCIIAASGLYDHAHAAEAASLGIAHFLSKPFLAQALLNVLRECLGKSDAPSS